HYASQAVECHLELRGLRWSVLLESLAVHVSTRRPRREVDLGDITLVQADEAALEAGGRTGEEKEKAARQRVERSRVSCPGLRSTARRGDDREGRRPHGLVDEEDPARLERARRH